MRQKAELKFAAENFSILWDENFPCEKVNLFAWPHTFLAFWLSIAF